MRFSGNFALDALPTTLFLLLCLAYYILENVYNKNVNSDGYYDVSNWKYHFPSGSGMGIYAALAIGVPDSPNIDLFLAVFFEAFYALPYNETSFEFPPDVSDRAFSRKQLYDSMESKLKLKGLPGKSCILKTICEAASYSMRHLNGLVGDLLYILLTMPLGRTRLCSASDIFADAYVDGFSATQPMIRDSSNTILSMITGL